MSSSVLITMRASLHPAISDWIPEKEKTAGHPEGWLSLPDLRPRRKCLHWKAPIGEQTGGVLPVCARHHLILRKNISKATVAPWLSQSHIIPYMLYSLLFPRNGKLVPPHTLPHLLLENNAVPPLPHTAHCTSPQHRPSYGDVLPTTMLPEVMPKAGL